MVIPSKKLQKYLTPRPNGKMPDGKMGLILKRDAPDDVKKEYKEYKKTWKAVCRD